MKSFNLLKKIFQVPLSNDSDDTRRRKLLNIMLYSVAAMVLIALIPITIFVIIQVEFRADAPRIYLGCVATLVMIAAIWINTRYSGKLAATIFLVFITTIFAFSDTPDQVAAGRALFIFTIPIVMASMLLGPAASFIFFGLSSLIITLIAIFSLDIFPNAPAIVGFLLIAIISWLSSRYLEQALRDLRSVNANLDNLVKERTQALENALLRERVALGQFQATLESLRDGVIVFNMDGNAVVANPAAARLFDLKREEILTKTIADLISSRTLAPQDRGALLGLLTTDTGQPINRRIRWGQQFLSVWSAPVYRGESLDRIGTVSLFQDVTVEVEAEKMKDMFLATVSHELRTPINAIMGYSDIMLNGLRGPMTDVQTETMGRISRNAQRLFELVGDLLDQAQIQAGTLKISLAEFNIASVLDEVRSVSEKAAADKKLTLSTHIEDNFPQNIEGDAGRVRQILVNLATNAIKFTDKGSVNVRAFCPDKRHWAVEVLDTGIGITEEKLTHIFDPFYQADNSLTRKVGGFGLGLTIVKNLVELMEGIIKVESKVGVGSIFTVTFPNKPFKRDVKPS